MKEIVSEIELYTGKLIEGDLTPIIFEMVQDSPDIIGLIRYLDKQEGKVTDVHFDRPSETTRDDCVNRPDFEVWCSECEVIMPIQRNASDT